MAGIRFLLALMVAMGHLASALADGTARYYGVCSGDACVAMFLVISGYCMAHSYGQEPAGFYRRRFWRIWPVYAFGLFLGLVPFALWGPHIALSFQNSATAPRWPEVVHSLLCIPPVTGYPLNTALWTVAAECLFYTLVPVLARLLPGYIVPVILASALIQYRLTDLEIYRLAISGSVLDALFLDLRIFWPFGLGWLLHAHGSRRWLQVLAVGLSTAVFLPELFRGEFGPLITGGGVVLLLNMERIQFPAKLAARLDYLGDLSYPLYAVHTAIAWLVALCYPSILVLQPALIIWLCLAIAALVLHGIDRPLRRLGRQPLVRRWTMETARRSRSNV